MSTHKLTDEALQDLDEIFNYLSGYSLDAVDRFLDALEKKYQNLVNFLQMGKSYEELAPQLRGVPIDGYILLYRLVGEDIEILRVVSGYRNLKSLFLDTDGS
ncbi:MAG: type II toxin-antitoxin system RelE/ParE family toxin [Hormoscilla sp. SP5CHS1]|nr:type II toxin-antitoxin system RelE/ParE family toxin [Hormoscilla sp. SP12CHS1]MBC6453349.1 type II toxin-antitoxin system RelE/ParE family toxin [Hormoscilla sp. SP5CHS1]